MPLGRQLQQWGQGCPAWWMEGASTILPQTRSPDDAQALFPADPCSSHLMRVSLSSFLRLPSAWERSEQIWAGISVSVKVLVAQSRLTLCDPMNCSPPGSSVHGILQARILEQIAVSSSRGSSRHRDWTSVSYVSCIGRRVLYHSRHLGSSTLSPWKWVKVTQF